MEMRLIRAFSLLRNRDVKITQVAEQCGFDHLGFFDSCFKRRFGARRGHWRDANRSAHAHPASLSDGEHHCQMRANGLCPRAGEPGSTKPARLSPARLANARSPFRPPAPRHRNGSAVAAVGVMLE